MKICIRLIVALVLLVLATFGSPSAPAQELATLSGRVTDPHGLPVPGVEVKAVNVSTNVSYPAETNEVGLYHIPSLPPGTYRIAVEKAGFVQIVKPGVELHVADIVAINFGLQVGSVTQSVTVEAGAPLVNTESGAVSTVINREFIENLPLNGRSFNTLLQLTPGVVIAPVTAGQTGQFSVSGQRTDANSFTVDGVSANFGVGQAQNPGESGTGGAQAFSVLGGTSSLVSVDALQEFRVETSSFAPEFGKTPGGQVILTTRSGTNDFHGAAFDYFRNTVMDANNWFNNNSVDSTTGKGFPRAPEHHNDFGGFLGGPIWKGHTFFFFSYEGARLRLPQTLVIQVPSKDARTSAPAALAPFLNAYPIPNGPVSAGDFTAQFTGSFSNSATLDATSIRIDHTFNHRFSIFGRYNDAPSQTLQNGIGPSTSISNLSPLNVNTRTLTVGLNMLLTPEISNTVRGNYSSQSNDTSFSLDSFGGAAPFNPSLLLGGLSPTNNAAFFETFDTVAYIVGNGGKNRTRQANFTDGLAATRGLHQLKFGADYRAIFLDIRSAPAEPFYFASTVQSFLSTGSVSMSVLTEHPSQFLAQSLSLYAQDTWKATPKLNITYGLRWELDPAPSARGNTTLAAFKDVNNPATINLVPSGASLWATTYGNFAPRFGIAYSLTSKGDFVIRAGGGIFYDLGVGSLSNLAFNFPNAAFGFFPSVPFPVTNITPFLPTVSLQPPFSSPSGFDPNLKLPRSYQWNVALEKSFGGQQAFTATYVGQAGRDLLRQTTLFQPNANFVGDIVLTRDDARSNYNALQLQFRRPLASRLQVLLNYAWSHSLDNVSNDITAGLPSNVISGANDYASSDFDVRHSFSAALSYDVPAAAKSGALAVATREWSVQSVVVARSGFPFNGLILFATPDPSGFASSRPDRVPGQPLYLSGSQCAAALEPVEPNGQQHFPCPGGKGLNPAVFAIPSPPRQGTEGRNDIPGFGFTQVDLSIGRRFAITERLNLQFRADAFNLLNHPNFRNPFGDVEFGTSSLKSSFMLNQSLGGLNPLFQEGGPRSLQLSLRLAF
jgi:hypothetical protein